MARQRDYAAEYRRRIERGLARGLSRTEARGHGASTPSQQRRQAIRQEFGVSPETINRLIREFTPPTDTNQTRQQVGDSIREMLRIYRNPKEVRELLKERRRISEEWRAQRMSSAEAREATLANFDRYFFATHGKIPPPMMFWYH